MPEAIDRGTPPPFTVGIEEEYLLVDLQTRAVAADPPEALFQECERKLEGLVAHEFLNSQIEVNSQPHATVTEAKNDLARLRRGVAEVAANYGLAPIASSTHPFSDWDSQRHTDRERYKEIAEDIQAPVRRLMICGMHVHVGIGGDNELRIDLLNQISYFLPHLLALSTSSPFWKGKNTGLKSYRLSVFDEMPRTGIPNQFQSYQDYRRHVEVLTQAGLIEDATKLWWDVRPSDRYPTLEMRITDVCPCIDDAAAIAALYTCILRMLYRLKLSNQRWRVYTAMLIEENRWRAQRYGLDDGLVDFGRGEIVPCDQLLGELIDLVREDAEALGCLHELEHLTNIHRRGTSAHRQLATFEACRMRGASEHEALQAVVDQLVAETTDVPHDASGAGSGPAGEDDSEEGRSA